MVIPESFILLLLCSAFLLSGWTHYRAIAAPESAALTFPFVIGLIALLMVFAFLMLGAAWPEWDDRRPIFLGLALGVFLAAFARLLHGRSKATG